MANTLSDDELFEKMRSKKNNVNKEKEKEKEKEDLNELNNIKKFGYDYYKILGLSANAEVSEIKRKYRHKIAEYHPDKLNFLSDAKKKVKSEQYQLIRTAGEILSNPEKKKIYDLERKTLKTKDFSNQKSSFDEFIKLQDSELTEDNKRKAELEFKKNIEKQNALRGFNPNELDIKFDKGTSDKLLLDLQSQRDMDNIEINHKNLFEGRGFNPSEFNKIFEKNKKKDDKKISKKQALGEMVKYDDGFTAFNDTGVGNFISVNDDYGELYGKDDFKTGVNFSRTKTGKSDDELSISSVSDVEFEDDYYNHSKKKITDDDIRKYERMRDNDTSQYDKMKFNEFKSALDDQFGISKDFGMMIGRDITQKPSQITSSMVDVYKKLIELSDSSDDE